MRTASGWMIAALAACSAGAHPDEVVARDPCAALAITAAAATPAQEQGVRDALALWRDRGVAAFDLGASDAGAAIEIQFADAAATFHGVYDPDGQRVVINRDLSDRAALAIVVAHELGHVFGLGHVDPATRISLMNPGNVATPPTDEDQRALRVLWGSCP